MRANLIYLLLFLLIGGLFGVGWMTQNPEAAWIERAEAWPAVGPLFELFRETYLGPDASQAKLAATEADSAEAAGTSEETALGVEPPIRIVRRPSPDKPRPRAGDRNARETQVVAETVVQEPIEPQEPVIRLGPSVEEILQSQRARATPQRAPAAQIIRQLSLPPGMTAVVSEYTASDVSATRWEVPGTRLFDAPGGTRVASLRALSRVPVLSRQGDWIEVGYEGRRHWIGPGSAPPPPGAGAKTKRLMPLKPNDASLLRKAKKILDLDEPNGMLGPYRLFTDVKDGELLRLLAEAAGQVERAYVARYGREPSGKARQAVILFAKESDYRSYHKGRDGFVDGGHAHRSTLAYYVGDNPDHRVVRTLVHEITHLLNRRALAPRLDPWLEEGLANDLGYWHHEQRSPITVESLGDRWLDVMQPGAASLQYLQDLLSKRELPPLAAVLTLEDEDFYVNEKSALHYGMSGFFVRYMMEGEDGTLALGFKEFLRALAYNQNANLVELLGRSSRDLEIGFRRLARQPESRAPRRGELARPFHRFRCETAEVVGAVR